MALSRTSAAWLLAGLTVAACTTERPRPLPASVPLGSTSEELQATDLHGTSLPNKTLALTFDDGPGDRAAELSSYLAGRGIRAAFFVNGDRIASSTLPNPNNITQTANVASILARIVADGHLVANHGVTHRDLVTAVLPTGNANLTRELVETDADIAGYVPSGHFLFRAPYGSYNQAVYDALRGGAMNKYVGPINWEIGGVSTNYPSQAADWACWQNKLQSGGGGAQFGATTQQCGDAYLAEITAVGRGIVLMHDPYFSATGSTVDMVKYMVPILEARGYSFVRVDEVPAIAALLPPPGCDASCATCTAGGACASCRGGSYLAGGACLTCGVCGDGTYVAAACTTTTNTVCAPCSASCVTCNAAGASHCTSCAGGAYLAAGTCRACSTCHAGRYEAAACTASADTVCSTCSPGTFTGAAGSKACTACDPGTCAGAPGSTSCSACAAGTFAPASGQTACSPCDPGLFSAGAGAAACSSCSAGTFAGGGATACTTCPAGTSSADGAAACIACAPGSRAGAGAATCAACDPGSYAAGAGATSCVPCAAGTFAVVSGASSCQRCAAGSFAASGAAECTSCGSCDDADACTKDACDDTQGCVHTREASCIADAGSADAAPPDAGTRDGATASDAGATDAVPPPSGQGSGGNARGDVTPPTPTEPIGGCTVTRVSRDTSGELGLALGAMAVALARRRRAATGSRADRGRGGT